ncbi:MAG: urease accessory protein UreE [Gammaproteobacteria bacterium]
MLVFTQRIDHVHDYSHTLTLAYELRQKARLKTKLDNGEEVGIMLPRGLVMRGGDCLQSEEGVIAKIIAAPEEVSVARTNDKLILAKACYHLGNRHMPLQIEEDCLIYQKDHVLDEMVKNLGLEITYEMRAFEPESGAYSMHNTTHSHGHSH